MRRTIFILGLITLAVVLLGCTGKVPTESPTASPPADTAKPAAEQDAPSAPPMPPAANWRTAVLTDSITGQTYTIDSLPKPILLESFAVWCPTCLKQQVIMGEVEGVTHLSLNTDPNEDDAIVKEHAEKHGFDWIFSVSSPAATQSLIDEFGIGVVNAPSVPIVLVCDDGARLLDRGLKQAAELREEIAVGCSA